MTASTPRASLRSPQGKGCATALRGYKDLKKLEATSGSERRKLRNSLRHEPAKKFACEAFASSVSDSAQNFALQGDAVAAMAPSRCHVASMASS